MDLITVSAKTLDEAITKALLELQTTSEHLHYEVVQKENTGLLGFFAKPCIIRARVMEEEEERALKKAASEKDRVQKAPKAEKEQAEKEVKKTEDKSSANMPLNNKPETKAPDDKVTEKAEKKNPEKKDIEKKDIEKKDFEKKDFERRKQERKESSRKYRQERKDVEKVPENQEKSEKAEKQLVKADPDKVQSAAKEFLVQVFAAMGMTVSVETSLNLGEGELLVMMSGDDMGILIGKRGQTLDSLQYLVSLVVNRETEGYLRVKLDTENYRERRKETLETLARNISYKVKRTTRPVSLEPMNPYERRIIHSALQNDRYVVTRSEGEDPYRHVVIFLKNDRYGNGRKDHSGGRRDREYDKSVKKPVEKPSEKTADKLIENAKQVNEESEM